MDTSGTGISRHFLAAALVMFLASVQSAEISDDFSVEVIGTGVYQLGDYEDAVDIGGKPLHNEAKGTIAVDGAVEYTPSDRDTFHSLLSWARGNGLKGLGGVSLDVNADDLEDDVKDINGRNRDYLLEAWYRRGLELTEDTRLHLTGGLLDATRYIDHNRVANDEITQFMNSAFVNRFFLPSYDPGLAAGAVGSAWHVDLVWMHAKTGPNKEGGVKYDFYGADLGVKVNTPFGEGNYHLIAETTSKDFEDRDGSGQVRRRSFGVSADQSIGDAWTVFTRFGWTGESASDVVHRAVYTGGAQLEGTALRLPSLVWGVAYGHLDGAGSAAGDIRETRVFESYARLTLNRFSDISLDVQYVRDELRAGPNPRVWVLGARLNGYY